MRALLLGLMIAAGAGLAGSPSATAAPAGATGFDRADIRGLLTEPVDCRRYPHRHRGAKPHGIGFGCPKKARPARTKRS